MADKMPLDINGQLRCLVEQLLHVVLPEHTMPAVVSALREKMLGACTERRMKRAVGSDSMRGAHLHVGGRLELGDRHQPHAAAGCCRRALDPRYGGLWRRASETCGQRSVGHGQSSGTLSEAASSCADESAAEDIGRISVRCAGIYVCMYLCEKHGGCKKRGWGGGQQQAGAAQPQDDDAPG